MSKKLIEMLTSYDEPLKKCIMGNEAVARGAIEAGVNGVFAYPGTPSTEISEVFNRIQVFQSDPDQQNKYQEHISDPIYFEFSINEKIAMEKAIAYSIGNRKAMCVMKSAGLNVGSDPLMTISYQTIGSALVIVVADDPGCFSSSNEQDSRYWGKMASVPVFNPSTPADAITMTKDAFALSELLKLPVIVRMTTRVSHSRGIVFIGNVSKNNNHAEFKKSPQHINIPARTAAAHRNLLNKLESEAIIPFQEMNTVTYVSNQESRHKSKLGIISCGVATAYALELINNNRLNIKIDILKIGIINPFPVDIVLKFLKCGFDKILVLEELDPIIEDEIRIIAQKNDLDVQIFGKGFAGLSPTGEFSLNIVHQAIEEFVEITFESAKRLPSDEVKNLIKNLPPRPPALCPGCPHRATWYTLKLALSSHVAKPVLCGDIGCFALGAFPPFQLIDTIHHMGMSISMAQGLSEAIHISRDEKSKVIAMLGDGTFFHSGIASILNAVYTKANIAVIIFDNRTIGMTGHQYHPGAVDRNNKDQVDLPALLSGLGVNLIKTVDPNELSESYQAIEEALAYKGVSVVIAKSPCVFLPEFKDEFPETRKIEVDHTLCNVCHNQIDSSITCSRSSTSVTTLAKARARITADYHIPANKQSCPANICNHGFLTAISTGNYKEALNIVRDKMIFAGVCGDICPKPCEYLYIEDDQPSIPIRKLKQFVASMEEKENDFSLQIAQMADVKKLNKSIAVIGAGPAGLSAAYDLIRTGYDVTVFDKEKEAGGLLKFAIPGFRIDKAGCDAEIEILSELGVKFRFDTVLGRDIEVESLSHKFDGVIIAIGMGLSTSLDMIEGNVAPGNRFDAITFLRQFNDETLSISKDSTIFIIGGGNSAIDAARAAKNYGVEDVRIIYRRTREEMPAFDEEVDAAFAEGVQITYKTVIDTCRMTDSGRISVTLKSFKDDQDLGEMQCDYIITATGQKGHERSVISEAVDIDKSNRITADPETGKTKYGNVFVAGDISADNHVSVIGAIASGKKAANGIRQLLEDYTYDYEGAEALRILNSPEAYRMKPRPSDDHRLTEAEVIELASQFEHYQVCGKCDHCIENFACPALIKINGKIVIDDAQCTKCGLCIDVCLNNAIHWVD
ncbi:FAD-dependent oxidoreductase [bacterium]|nr:FAD-dependent oxidoreductase [bacterium]